MIGPEGGFSEAEYAMALSHQVQGMTLGPRILRTETAVVSALTILQAQYGDL
jgi:16S rRNA (uracil1498-N3)-methyltransferase